MKHSKTSLKYINLMTLVVFLGLYVAPLGIRPLFIPDEARYAEIPREMIQSGDWVVPRLNGLRYFEKPPLGYWINCVSFLLFGENKFAARFPSALAIGLTALLIFLLLRHFFAGKSPPVLAPFIFLTSLEAAIIGGINILDGILTFLLTGCIGAFFLASESRPGSKKERVYLCVSGFFCGLAFLTKGFLALAIPAIVFAPYLLWQRRCHDILRLAILPLATTLLTVLPWSLLIHIREPDFWRYFFWVEHIRRFTGGNEAQHSEPFWYFAAVLPGAFLPWSFLVPAAFSGLKEELKRGKGDQKRLIVFTFFWFLMPFLFFSASSGKLMTYILPCFPPLTILVATGLHTKSQAVDRLLKGGAITALLIVCLILLGGIGMKLLIMRDILPFDYPHFNIAIVIVSLAAGIATLFCSLRIQGKPLRVLCFGLTPIFLLFSVNFIIPKHFLEKRALGSFLSRHKKEVSETTILVSERASVAMVCWTFKRNDVYLLNNGGELNYGLNYNDAKNRKIDFKKFIVLTRRHHGHVALIAWADHFETWESFLPKPIIIYKSGKEGFVFARY